MCNQKPELNQKPDKNAPIGVFDSGVGGRRELSTSSRNVILSSARKTATA